MSIAEIYNVEGEKFRVVTRQDIRTLWYDVQQYVGGEWIQCGSDKTLEDALLYINPVESYDDQEHGCCGGDYHMADCPIRTGYHDSEAQYDYDQDDYYAESYS